MLRLPSNTVPNWRVGLKGVPQSLFGGAIAASVTEANSTSIDMSNYTAGQLDITVNSGTGTFSLALMGSEVNSGVFKQLYNASGAISPIVTIASTSTSILIQNIYCTYFKLVPTLTGTANVTFLFTPVQM